MSIRQSIALKFSVALLRIIMEYFFVPSVPDKNSNKYICHYIIHDQKYFGLKKVNIWCTI